MRAKLLGVLLATALVIAAVAVGPAAAAEATPENAEGSPAAAEASPEGVTVAPGGESESSAVTGEVAPLSKSQCPAGYMCVWSGRNWEGNFSAWPESNTGCHSHSENSSIRSWWNRTGYTVRLGGWGTSGPHSEPETFVLESTNPITGEICWPA